MPHEQKEEATKTQTWTHFSLLFSLHIFHYQCPLITFISTILAKVFRQVFQKFLKVSLVAPVVPCSMSELRLQMNSRYSHTIPIFAYFLYLLVCIVYMCILTQGGRGQRHFVQQGASKFKTRWESNEEWQISAKNKFSLFAKCWKIYIFAHLH